MKFAEGACGYRREPQSNRTNQNQTTKTTSLLNSVHVKLSCIELSSDAHRQMAGKMEPARFPIWILMGTVCGQDHQ